MPPPLLEAGQLRLHLVAVASVSREYRAGQQHVLRCLQQLQPGRRRKDLVGERGGCGEVTVQDGVQRDARLRLVLRGHRAHLGRLRAGPLESGEVADAQRVVVAQADQRVDFADGQAVANRQGACSLQEGGRLLRVTVASESADQLPGLAGYDWQRRGLCHLRGLPGEPLGGSELVRAGGVQQQVRGHNVDRRQILGRALRTQQRSRGLHLG